MKVKVRCVRDYFDLELNKLIKPNEKDDNYERVITRERADEIIDKTQGAIEIIETLKEEKKLQINLKRQQQKNNLRKKKQ